MASSLIIDVRTPAHIEMVSQLLSKNYFDSYRDFFIIAPENLDIPDWLGEIIFYDFSPAKYSSLFKIIKFIYFLESRVPRKEIVDLLSPLNFGPLHDVLNSRIKISFFHMFEDGISSYLDLDINYRLLKQTLISVVTCRSAKIASKKFFLGSDDKNTIIYSNKPKIFLDLALVRNIKFVPDQWDNGYGKLNIIYFLSSASLEYGMQNLGAYKNMVEKISRFYTNRSVVVSFHHNESLWQQKLDIIRSYFSVERIIRGNDTVESDVRRSGGLVELIAPYNSAALNLLYANRLSKLYLYSDNGPNIETRKKLFSMLKNRSGLELKIYD